MTKSSYPDAHHDVSSNTIFGFWRYLMTDCVMFASFFAAYVVLQGGTFGGPLPRDIIHLPSSLVQTLILLASSFSCGFAMLQAPSENKRKLLAWLALTFILGLVFFLMEWSELSYLVIQGSSWRRSAFLSAYFTLIGMHGVHIVVGLLLMIFFGVQLYYRGFTAAVLRRLTCLRIYWQFIYLIWIFTFTFVHLMGVS
jgi:Heme/copper-type cytochrome/quinol oxidase, subunit 3